MKETSSPPRSSVPAPRKEVAHNGRPLSRPGFHKSGVSVQPAAGRSGLSDVLHLLLARSPPALCAPIDQGAPGVDQGHRGIRCPPPAGSAATAQKRGGAEGTSDRHAHSGRMPSHCRRHPGPGHRIARAQNAPATVCEPPRSRYALACVCGQSHSARVLHVLSLE